MHAASELDVMWRSSGLSQSQNNQAMGYSRENNKQARLRTYFFERIPWTFRFVTLPMDITKKTKLHPWKFPKILLHTLGIPKHPKTKTQFHMKFLYHPWNSNSFLLDPWNFHMLFLHSILLKFHVLNPHCCFDLFRNSLVTKLCVVVLFSQKYY